MKSYIEFSTEKKNRASINGSTVGTSRLEAFINGCGVSNELNVILEDDMIHNLVVILEQDHSP